MEKQNDYAKLQKYMFDNVAEDDEKLRLAVLNETHTPKTMTHLKPVLAQLPINAKVLEIGCGEGALALEVAKVLPESATLLATDAELPQVETTNQKLLNIAHAKAQQINFISDYDKLKALAPFDLIYCRWVICHLKVNKQIEILASLFKLLANGGSFVIDDCDNRAVEYRLKPNADIEQSQQLASQVTSMFTEFYDPIANARGLNLKCDASSWVDLFKQASIVSLVEGDVTILGEYQVVFSSEKDKHAVTLGKISASQAYTDITGVSAKPIIEAYQKAEKDNNIECAFLNESVVMFKKS